MKLLPKLTALSLVICASMIPLTAQAGNNYQTQQIILNNFNTAEQNTANQVNAYVSSGQLSPQQGAAFNSELSQIASQSLEAATNPGVTSLVMSELSSLDAQINASLGVSGQWYPIPVYGAVRGPGRYSWRPRAGGFQHNGAGQRQFQSNQEAGQRQFQDQQARARNGMVHQQQANNAIEHANDAHVRAANGQYQHQQQANQMIARANAGHARAANEQQHQQQANQMIARANAGHARAATEQQQQAQHANMPHAQAQERAPEGRREHR
jgi:hypothetical protein